MIHSKRRAQLDDWVLGRKRIHALDSLGHNWWSARMFGAGMARLAVVDEEPRAKDWLNRISDGSVEWFDFAASLLDNKPRSFDVGGGFFEDVNYASFAVSQYLLFRLAVVLPIIACGQALVDPDPNGVYTN